MNDIYLYGEVGYDFSGSSFRDELFSNEGDVSLHINSCGGDVFDGVAISALISDYRRKGNKVVAYIDGLAASAASYMALTADEVVVNSGAQFMIHNPMASCLWANADEMRKTADSLDSIKESIVALYVNKTGKDSDEIKADMDAETWLTAEQAVEYGIADRIDTEALKVAAKVDSKFADIYKHVPSNLEDRHVEDTVQTDADNVEAEVDATEANGAEAEPTYVDICGELFRID